MLLLTPKVFYITALTVASFSQLAASQESLQLHTRINDQVRSRLANVDPDRASASEASAISIPPQLHLGLAASSRQHRISNWGCDIPPCLCRCPLVRGTLQSRGSLAAPPPFSGAQQTTWSADDGINALPRDPHSHYLSHSHPTHPLDRSSWAAHRRPPPMARTLLGPAPPSSLSPPRTRSSSSTASRPRRPSRRRTSSPAAIWTRSTMATFPP